MVLDSGTSRIFVAGDDRVVVLAADGTVAGSVPNIAGAYGMDAAQGFVWVNESTAGKIAKIDPTTMSVVQTFTVGGTVGDSLAIVGDAAWIGIGPQASGLVRFDLTDSTKVALGSSWGRALHVPGTTAEVFALGPWGASGVTASISNIAPYTTIENGPGSGYFGDAAIKNDGAKFWMATGSPYDFQEFSMSTMTSTGVHYDAEPYPQTIAWSPGHGGLVAGRRAHTFYLYAEGTPAPIAKLPVAGGDAVTKLALSADGNTAYLLSAINPYTPAAPPVFQVIDLRPTITSVGPATVVRNVPTIVTLTGSSLGGAHIGDGRRRVDDPDQHGARSGHVRHAERRSAWYPIRGPQLAERLRGDVVHRGSDEHGRDPHGHRAEQRLAGVRCRAHLVRRTPRRSRRDAVSLERHVHVQRARLRDHLPADRARLGRGARPDRPGTDAHTQRRHEPRRRRFPPGPERGRAGPVDPRVRTGRGPAGRPGLGQCGDRRRRRGRRHQRRWGHPHPLPRAPRFPVAHPNRY